MSSDNHHRIIQKKYRIERGESTLSGVARKDFAGMKVKLAEPWRKVAFNHMENKEAGIMDSEHRNTETRVKTYKGLRSG